MARERPRTIFNTDFRESTGSLHIKYHLPKVRPALCTPHSTTSEKTISSARSFPQSDETVSSPMHLGHLGSGSVHLGSVGPPFKLRRAAFWAPLGRLPCPSDRLPCPLGRLQGPTRRLLGSVGPPSLPVRPPSLPVRPPSVPVGSPSGPATPPSGLCRAAFPTRKTASPARQTAFRARRAPSVPVFRAPTEHPVRSVSPPSHTPYT